MNVLVYSGEGSSRISLAHTVRSLQAFVGHHYDVMKIDAKGLQTEPWEESTALLVIPGGRDIPYTQALNGAVADKIRAYVQAGGRYWGICAGAYFASDRIAFEIGTPFEVQGSRELKFFPGECRGVVYPGFVYDSEQGASSVKIQLNDDAFARDRQGFEETRVYFNGGGYFVDAEKYPNTQILGWYSEKNDGDITGTGGERKLKAAIIACQVASYAAELTKSLKSLATSEGLIKESNDTFQLIPTPQDTVPVHTSTLSETAEGESEEKYIKNLVLCPDGAPPSSLTPQFAIGEFFKHLQHVRQQLANNASLSNLYFGNCLMYGEIVSSTQTMLDKNFTLCQHLPNGFVCNATTQVAGRGRGRNSWISPPGCLQFSMVLRHPVQARHASAVFVQYLVALAVVESVCSLPGYEDVPLRLKWPNDIYAEAPPIEEGEEKGKEPSSPLKMVKIGGVLVNSNFSGSEFLLVIGCGVNTTNPNPTTSINHIIRHHNKVTGKNLNLFTQETLLAHILVKLEEMYHLFLHGDGTGFAQLEQTYYKRWLHANAFVTLTTMTPHRKVRIKGITLDYGLLRTVAVDEQGQDIVGEEHRLQPDGNSFDMLKGLISTKA
ncbi:biotin holocarboxylase synthetase [Modicella reniformis]|uniref:Biotin holocarboxylase synthetase n=1 Tax=Modicella reniformis TaxID=1440133 RepID=A0A9P6LTT2_9FUNG|nr:biotin holocarboxylase synthetase [Modicella reniformis]